MGDAAHLASSVVRAAVVRRGCGSTTTISPGRCRMVRATRAASGCRWNHGAPSRSAVHHVRRCGCTPSRKTGTASATRTPISFAETFVSAIARNCRSGISMSQKKAAVTRGDCIASSPAWFLRMKLRCSISSALVRAWANAGWRVASLIAGFCRGTRVLDAPEGTARHDTFAEVITKLAGLSK